MHTDRENSDPNRAVPMIDNDELQRAELRNAKDAPRWKKSMTESDEPNCAMLLKETEHANWINPTPRMKSHRVQL